MRKRRFIFTTTSRYLLQTSHYEIFSIFVTIANESGWVQMNTYKGETILEPTGMDEGRASLLFDESVMSEGGSPEGGRIMEEIIELPCRSRPVGVAMKIVDNKIVVQEVEPGTVASEKEIQSGDILCSVNGEEVKNPQETLRAFGHLSTPFLLSFCRQTIQPKAASPRPIRKSLAHRRRKVVAPPRGDSENQIDARLGSTPGEYMKLADDEDSDSEKIDEPGTWICDMCHAKNKLGQIMCTMCDTPKKSAPPEENDGEEKEAAKEVAIVVDKTNEKVENDIQKSKKLRRSPEESEKNIRFEEEVKEEKENVGDVDKKREAKPAAVVKPEEKKEESAKEESKPEAEPEPVKEEKKKKEKVVDPAAALAAVAVSAVAAKKIKEKVKKNYIFPWIRLVSNYYYFLKF